VFDYLDFHAFGYHWPAFNLSDSFILIGVVLLLSHQTMNQVS
jgi:signal peptidase II